MYVCMYVWQAKKNCIFDRKNYSGVTDYMHQATSISIYVCTKATLFIPCYLYIYKKKYMNMFTFKKFISNLQETKTFMRNKLYCITFLQKKKSCFNGNK
jgi:hypothetical protein